MWSTAPPTHAERMDENTPNTEPTDARPQVGGTVLDDHDRPDQTATMNAAPPPTAWYDVPVARSATDSKVGKRAGVDVMLRIDTGRLRAAGLTLYRSSNGVLLVRAVPPGCIGGLVAESRKARDQEHALRALFAHLAG